MAGYHKKLGDHAIIVFHNSHTSNGSNSDAGCPIIVDFQIFAYLFTEVVNSIVNSIVGEIGNSIVDSFVILGF